MSTRHTYTISENPSPTSWETSASKFIARQPIFDRRQQVFGYELLFRSPLNNFCVEPDPTGSSRRVVLDDLFLDGFEKLRGDRKAFLKFTWEELVSDYALSLPNGSAVAEIPKTVKPDEEVLAACRRLKDFGHSLALDGVCFTEIPKSFAEMVDVVKVDISNNTPKQIQEMVHLFCGPQYRPAS